MSDHPLPIAEFGHGRWTVDMGLAGDRPAVFIAPAVEPGVVGELVPDDLAHPRDSLSPGEFYMTFPTEEQARRVAEAICNITVETWQLRPESEAA
jgi:hypothetical protein